MSAAGDSNDLSPHSATFTLLSSPRVRLLISTHAQSQQSLFHHHAVWGNLSKNLVLSSLRTFPQVQMLLWVEELGSRVCSP